MIHKLKIWPQFYCRVAEGSKNFEIRKNDRAFQSGDLVELNEWNPASINNIDGAPLGFTKSPPLTFKIGYIQILDAHNIVFSLLPVKISKKP